MHEQYPADRYVQTPSGVFVEWRRDITDPDTLFDNDITIEQATDVLCGREMTIGMPAMNRGVDWNDYMDGAGDGTHNLRAVVNVSGMNIGVTDTVVDGCQVTYITRMGTNPNERASLLGVLDTPAEGETSLTLIDPERSNRWEGNDRGLVTFKKGTDGQVSVVNESFERVRVGTKTEPRPESTLRERFSLRSIYDGLKKVIRGEHGQAGSRKYEAIVGKVNWMVSIHSHDFSVPEAARWMRKNQHGWYVTQPA